MKVDGKIWSPEGFTKPDSVTLKKQLTPEQFKVTQEEATEPPFRNSYWDHKEPGLYVDVVSGEPLFLSTDKFDSGTGWPSFTRPISESVIAKRIDRKLWIKRTEVHSKLAGSHLGHVFDDGPAPTGLRYCINSASLRFIPVNQLEHEGYGKWRHHLIPAKAEMNQLGKDSSMPSDKTTHTSTSPGTGTIKGDIATLAGGCFWGVEELFRELPGVTSTRVGYIGGNRSEASYEVVKTGKTGHAEAIEISFDPAKISYEEILQYFFRLHDPTTVNRQGNDVGRQYRSAIFYHGERQRSAAESVKNLVEKSGKWSKPVITEIVAATDFFAAEEYHQKYLEKNPGGYTCHYLRD